MKLILRMTIATVVLLTYAATYLAGVTVGGYLERQQMAAEADALRQQKILSEPTQRIISLPPMQNNR